MAQESMYPNNFHSIYVNLVRFLSETNKMVNVDLNLSFMRERKDPNSDLLDYVFGFMKEFNLFPDTTELEEEKSDAESEEIRQQGNSFFSLMSKQYPDALREYNRSICYATSKENISIGLANRSAVFFEMEMFPECLESIRLAREFGYPERLKEKLERREVKCREAMKEKKPAEEAFVPKIDLPVNEKIPFVAKCLELRENSKFGRHLVTEESISAGSIIAHVEPYCTALMEKEKYLRCAMCLAEVPHLLLPCDNCTQAMFCSQECRKKANESFHGIECPISGSLFKIFGADVGCLLVFRMIIRTFQTFPDTETMRTALEKMNREKRNIFSFDCSKKLSPEELYTPIHSLISHDFHRKPEYHLRNYVVACLMYNFLEFHCPIFRQSYLITDEADDLLKEIIFRHSSIASMNSYTLTVIEDTSDREVSHEYGRAISSFYSVINHSCSDNVALFPISATPGISGLVAIKNIAAGEQIFVDYGFSHVNMARAQRQEEIFNKYAFHCKCVACFKNFPLQNDLQRPLDIPESPLRIADQTQCVVYSFDFGMKGFKMASEFIKRFGHLYPILQLCTATETLLFCLFVICGNVSLRIREKIRLNNAKKSNK